MSYTALSDQLTTSDAILQRYKEGLAAHKDEFHVAITPSVAPYADDGGYVDPWVMGLLVVFDEVDFRSMEKVFHGLARWLRDRPERDEVVAALLTVVDSAPDRWRLNDALVEALAGLGWRDGRILAEVWRTAAAVMPRSTSKAVIDAWESKTGA